MSEINIEISQEAKEVSASTDLILKEALDFKIVSPADLETSANILKTIKQKKKKIDEVRKSLTRPLDAAKKGIMDFFRPAENKLSEAENAMQKTILEFREMERRKAEEEQRKIAEEAKKRQEEELARIQKEQEEAEMLGDSETVENLEIQKTVAATTVEVATVVTPEEPKLSGVAEVKRWKAVVTDKMALIKHIAETGQFENLIEFSNKELNALATATKGTIQIPGIEFKAERSLAVRN